MSNNISFNEEPLPTIAHHTKEEKASTLEKIVLSTGIVKTKKGVKLFFITLICLAWIGMAFIWFSGSSESVGDSYGNYDDFSESNPDIIE